MVLTFIRRIKGANGRNWPGIVFLSPAAPLPAAAWAQEAWEAQHKLNPVAFLQTRISRSARRRMEVMGHEVEAQAAHAVYGRNLAAYRLAEARAMHRGYDGLFSGMTPDDIAARMAVQAPKAAAWVRQHIKQIQRYKSI